MNKLTKFALILVGVVILSYVFAAQTGVFKPYKSPTIANEPNLKANTYFFASNLVAPKIGDFVCYNSEDRNFGRITKVHKLCGMENDMLEIKNGVVYLNNVNIDTQFDHIHIYKVTTEEYANLKTKETISDENMVIPIDLKNVLIFLADSIAKKYELTSKRIIEEKNKPDKHIQVIFKNNWNKDNFGPLKIPVGKVFVMGDNRDNSEDSRYNGFVDKSDIIGTVIYK
ncbi:MAG: signal peptidase I [Flavobacterium sp.]